MKAIFQKNKHNPDKGIIGDCLQASICSLLEISDSKVLNFAEDKNYPKQLDNFLKKRGLILKYSDHEPINIDYYMVWGMSPRGLKHSVIYHNEQMIHDPYPGGGGVIPNEYVWLEEYN